MMSYRRANRQGHLGIARGLAVHNDEVRSAFELNQRSNRRFGGRERIDFGEFDGKQFFEAISR
jgi:hypothetical protein